MLNPEITAALAREYAFACSECGATLTDCLLRLNYTSENSIYYSDPDGSRHSMLISNPINVLSCGHVLCRTHIGLVPFHPKDVAPTIECPLCAAEGYEDATAKVWWFGGHREEHVHPDMPDYFLRARTLDDMKLLCYHLLNFAHQSRKQAKEHLKSRIKFSIKVSELEVEIAQLKETERARKQAEASIHEKKRKRPLQQPLIQENLREQQETLRKLQESLSVGPSSFEETSVPEEPPTEELPTEKPPTEEPLTEEPPTEEPYIEEPPTEEPPSPEQSSAPNKRRRLNTQHPRKVHEGPSKNIWLQQAAIDDNSSPKARDQPLKNEKDNGEMPPPPLPAPRASEESTEKSVPASDTIQAKMRPLAQPKSRTTQCDERASKDTVIRPESSGTGSQSRMQMRRISELQATPPRIDDLDATIFHFCRSWRQVEERRQHAGEIMRRLHNAANQKGLGSNDPDSN